MYRLTMHMFFFLMTQKPHKAKYVQPQKPSFP